MNDDQNVESVNHRYDHCKPEANGDGSLDDVLCLADYLRHGSDDESQRVDARDNPITNGLLKQNIKEYANKKDVLFDLPKRQLLQSFDLSWYDASMQTHSFRTKK